MLNKDQQKYSCVKVVASLQKLITYCRWADIGGGSSNTSESQVTGLLSLNFKQWLLTLVNDCFYFLLHEGEPILAFEALKFAESYFCSQNDTTEYYLHQTVGEKDETVQMEVNQHVLNEKKSYDLIAQSIRDPQGEVLQQSQIEQKVMTEQNLITDIAPMQLPKNLFAKGGKDCKLIKESDKMYLTQQSKCYNYQLLSLKNMFQVQYTHLIFYCMIQFRNYQATSFNILFLVISNFISQRQIDPTFLRHFKQNMEVIMLNYIDRKKTNEYEMFLGSGQKLNQLVDPLSLCSSF